MKEDNKVKKGLFARHAKSSAALISLGIHAALILIAISFVAVTVITKDDKKFEAKPVHRPVQKLKRLQVPVNVKKNKPKPKLRKRVVVKNVTRKTPEFQMPEITGVKGGMAGAGDGLGGVGSIGFTMPEMDFFGAKAKGDKVVFVVHFGPATIHDGRSEDENGNKMPAETYNNPFTRMTGLTIRNRLEDLVDTLPEYTLFNVVAYFAGDAWAMEPRMQLATSANKQKVKDWMEPVNPLEGKYDFCFNIPRKDRERIDEAYKSYPTRVDQLPDYSTKWAFPYKVPGEIEKKYAPDAASGFMHWGRGVAWAILEQKPDTIFVLTTNYIDGWRVSNKEAARKGITEVPDQPRKMTKSLQKMCVDIYGPDKKSWPTINVVVLAKAGKDSTRANDVLRSEFGPIISGFKSDGSVIDNIRQYMNDQEQELYLKYKAQFGSKQGNN